MKNLYRFSLLIVMFLCAVAANAQHKIIKAVDSNETTHDYFYNDKGQLVWEIYGLNARIYVYNEAGQNTTTTQYSWVSANNAYKAIQEETCTYDADGNLTEKNIVKNAGLCPMSQASTGRERSCRSIYPPSACRCCAVRQAHASDDATALPPHDR